MSSMQGNRRVRAALLKVKSRWGDVSFNIDLLEQMAVELQGRSIDVLITPECFLDGYMERDRGRCTPEGLRACAVEGFQDPVMQRAAKLAARLESYLVVGASELGADRRLRNAAYLIDRQGELAGTYYKIQTSLFYTPGNELPVFQTDFGRAGIVICADRRWPENMRCLRLKGAEVILNPTWGDKSPFNTALMRVRAYENGIPVCFAHPEQSLICSEEGEVIALCEASEPDILIHEFELKPVRQDPGIDGQTDVSDMHPADNRRPDLYGAIVARDLHKSPSFGPQSGGLT